MAKTGRGKETNAKKAQREAAQAAAKAQTERASTAKETALISERNLLQVSKQDDTYKNDIDKLTGERREMLGNAKEKKHLNTKAYGFAKRFDRYKSDEALYRDYNDFLAYMEMMGVLERIAAVGALPLEQPSSEELEDKEAEEEGGTDNVTRGSFGATAH